MTFPGGNPPQRLDQLLQPTSRAGVGPAPQSNVFFGRLVVVFGTGPATGIFFYNGTPAHGNPPILAITTASADPYGNTVTASAITDSAMPFLVYSASPATGDLMLSVAPAAGTDAFGNHYPQGLKAKNTSGSQFIELATGGQAAVFVATGATEEALPSALQAQITNPGVSEFLTAFFTGPKGSVHNDTAGVFLNSAAADGSTTAGGVLDYTDTSAVEHFFLEWGIHGVKVFSAITGDTSSYQTERATLPQGSDLVINQTTFGQQILGTQNVGAGRYHMRGQILYQPAAVSAGVPEFEMSGSATVSTMNVPAYENLLGSNSAYTTEFSLNWQTLLQPFNGAAFGTTGKRTLQFDGTVTFSAAGTMGMFAATSVAADTFTVFKEGSYWEWFPVGP